MTKTPDRDFPPGVLTGLFLLLFFGGTLIALGYPLLVSGVLGGIGASAGAGIVILWNSNQPAKSRTTASSPTASKRGNAPTLAEAQHQRLSGQKKGVRGLNLPAPVLRGRKKH